MKVQNVGHFMDYFGREKAKENPYMCSSITSLGETVWHYKINRSGVYHSWYLSELKITPAAFLRQALLKASLFGQNLQTIWTEALERPPSIGCELQELLFPILGFSWFQVTYDRCW